MSVPADARAPLKLPGIIDTLGTGYQAVNRHPYLLLVPVLLDLFYWLGPRLSVGPVAQSAMRALEEAAASPAMAQSQAQTAQSVNQLKTLIDGIGQSWNLFSILSSALSIPSFLTVQEAKPPAWLGDAATISIATGGGLLALAALLFVIGTLIGAVYLGLAAQVVRGGRISGASLARAVPVYAGRFLGLVFMLLMLAFLLSLPVILALTLLTMVLGPQLALTVTFGIAFIAYIYLFFTTSALFVSELGPLQAVRSSLRVVRQNTASAMRLFLVMSVISLGISLVWGALGSSEIATLLSIAGNTYIETGLTVATMVFYRDRIKVLSGQPSAV